MKLLMLLLMLFGSLSIYCMNSDRDTTRCAPNLPPEITVNIITNLFDKKFSNSAELLKEIRNALNFLSTSRDFQRQKDLLTKALIKFINQDLLDETLVEAINKNAISAIDILTAAGAVLCRKYDSKSCSLLKTTISEKNSKKVSLIMKTLNQIITNNPKFEINYVTLHVPFEYLHTRREGIRAYITVKSSAEKKSLLSFLLETNDLPFIKNFFEEANKNHLTELIKEVLLPTINTSEALIKLLNAPILVQNYLFDQAYKNHILNEMLKTTIDNQTKFIPLTYALSMINEGHLSGIAAGTIENLLKQGKRVDSKQLFIPTTDLGKPLNAQEFVEEILKIKDKIIEQSIEEEDFTSAIDHQLVGKQYEKALSLIKKYQ
jgi:hypothetical protein